MDYEAFKQYVQEHIREFLPPEAASNEIILTTAKKEQDKRMEMLTMKTKSSQTVNIFLSHLYDFYEQGAGIDEVLRKIAGGFVKKADEIDRFFSEYLTKNFSFENLKDHIYPTVRNAEWNGGIMDELPHETRDDLAIVYQVEIKDKKGLFSFLIHDSYIKAWGICEEMLKRTAWDNLHRNYPPTVAPLSYFMMDTGQVLSRPDRREGAIYMLDRGWMEQMARRSGKDLIVIPSSIHECILLDREDHINLEDLQRMVGEVNEYCVRDDEVLSNSVYLFEKDTLSLSRFDPGEQAQGMNMMM